MKLFQIAFLLFNIVAISAEELIPPYLQFQWSQYYDRETGEDKFAYEERSNFLTESHQVKMDEMNVAYLESKSGEMRGRANDIIEKYKPPAHTEAKDPEYAVTFIRLKEHQVEELIRMGDGRFESYPKLVTGQVRIDRNFDKVMDQQTLESAMKGIARGMDSDFGSPDCDPLLKKHFKPHFPPALEGQDPDKQSPIPLQYDRMIYRTEFADLLKTCIPTLDPRTATAIAGQSFFTKKSNADGKFPIEILQNFTMTKKIKETVQRTTKPAQQAEPDAAGPAGGEDVEQGDANPEDKR